MNNFAARSQKPPRHLLGAKEAEELFKPYKSLLSECIQAAWDAWETFYKPRHHILRSRCRANVLYDEIVFNVGQKFSALPEVVFKPFRSSFLLYIGDLAVVRFKKFRKDGRCSNIRTRQQNLFQHQMELPGLESGTMFQAGYFLDELQQKIERIAIVCQFGKSVLYSIELLGDVAPIVQLNTTPVPLPPTTGRFELKSEAMPKSEKGKKHRRKGA
jgi:hypothetical protein